MTELTLDPGIVTLIINNRKLSFHADSDFAERVSALATEASERAEVARLTHSRNPKQVTEFLASAIDYLIGEGTVEELFAEKTPDVLDLMDILDAVADAFHNYRMTRLQRIREGSV